ncbi:hypothetical protein HK097_005534, partial [Rhizophlyctis rosea]
MINLNLQQTTPARKSPHLPPELLSKVFAYLLDSSPSLTEYTSTSPHLVSQRAQIRNTLYSACLVSKSWYFPAVEALWHSPEFLRIEDYVLFLKRFGEGSVEQEDGTDKEAKGKKVQTRTSKSTKTFYHRKPNPPNPIGTTGHPSIRRLNFTLPPLLPSYISPPHLSTLSSHPPPLTHLSLANCRTLTDTDILPIVTILAPRLTSLDLTNCWQLTNLPVQVLSHFCGPWKRLKRLSLNGCGFIGDAGLVKLGIDCGKSLESLDVSGCWRVSDAGLVKFLWSCEKAVRKRGMGGDDDEEMEGDDDNSWEDDVNDVQGDSPAEKARYRPVSISHVRGRVAEVGRLEPLKGRLRELRFNGCRKITRQGFEYILYTIRTHHSNLQTLSLSIPVAAKGSHNTSYTTFPTTLLPSLKTLHLHRAKYLKSSQLLTLISHLSKTLENIAIHDAHDIGQDVWVYLISE